MKKLILSLGLFIAILCTANASDIVVTQGQGVIYGYTDTIYGYPSFGSSGEITPVNNVLIAGYVTNYGGGFAGVDVDVDTDYSMGNYYAGDFPGGAGEFYIELL